MNPSESDSSDEALDEVATTWICERDEGFTPARAEAFAAWCERDPRHAAAVARVEAALALLGEMPMVRAPLEARFGRTADLADQPGGERRAPLSFPAWMTGLAAVLVIGLIAWWMNAPSIFFGERYATDAVAQRRVTLRDGSVVDLNATSELRVQFTGQERRVVLETGEAHFQVAPDAARPFVVTAGGVSVRAVGTAFNVRLAADAVDVLVVEGKVEVHQDTPETTETAAVRPMLGAGERARVARDDPSWAPQVEKVAPASIRALLAWQDPLMSFTDTPLRDVLAQFNRRNATQLVLADAELGERKIGGVIALDQVEAFVRLLEQDGDIVVERRGVDEIVLRRAR